jgi:hypothetical protein
MRRFLGVNLTVSGVLVLMVGAGMLALNAIAAPRHTGARRAGVPPKQQQQIKIQLSPTQMAKLNQLKAEDEPRLKALDAQTAQQQKELNAYIASPGSTQAEATKRFSTLVQSQEALGKLKIEILFKTRAIIASEPIKQVPATTAPAKH